MPSSPSQPIGGALNPRRWRTSKDTEEIAGLLKSCDFSTPKNRFDTTSKVNLTDMTAKKKNELFCEETLRKLRVKIERGSMSVTEKDKDFITL